MVSSTLSLTWVAKKLFSKVSGLSSVSMRTISTTWPQDMTKESFQTSPNSLVRTGQSPCTTSEWFGDFCLRMRQSRVSKVCMMHAGCPNGLRESLRDYQERRRYRITRDQTKWKSSRSTLTRKIELFFQSLVDPNTTRMIQDETRKFKIWSETLEFIKTNQHEPLASPMYYIPGKEFSWGWLYI